MARPAILLALVILASPFGAAAAPASEPAVAAPAALPPIHSESRPAHLEVDLAYLGPAPIGTAGILEVGVTARDLPGDDVVLTVEAPDLTLVRLSPIDVGDVGAEQTVVVRYAVMADADGVHAITARAVGGLGMAGERYAWLVVDGLQAAVLMLDYRADEPVIGEALEIVDATTGGDAVDEAVEVPEESLLAWPELPDDEAAGAAQLQTFAAGEPGAAAAGATVTAQLCWNFATPDGTGGKTWQRARWTNYRLMAEVPGPDRELAHGLTGKDGCVRVSGVQRTVDGAPARLYFAMRVCNSAVCVIGKDAPNGYVWTTPRITVGSGDLVDFGERGPGSRDYAARIYARANNGWHWFVNVALTPKGIVPPLDIHAPAQDGPSWPGCTCYDYKDVWIEVDGFRDVNEETMIHEYAHHIHYALAPAAWPQDAGGKHSLCQLDQRAGLAWTEGVAVFAAIRANFDLGAMGVPGASGDRLMRGTEDIESDPCGNGGTQNEWRVARVLWDLTDTTNDGVDDGWWNVPDVVFMIRSCGGQSLADFFEDASCGWRSAGRNVCVFLRSSYQNGYDLNAAPTASITSPASDTWVRGSRQLTASASDPDAGTGNCPTRVDFRVSATGNCAATTLVGSDAQPPYDVSWNTASATNHIAYSVCVVASDGMESRTVKSAGRYKVDNLAPTLVIDYDPGSTGWFNGPAMVSHSCSDSGVGMSNQLVYPYYESRLDNGTWEADPFPIITVEGRHWGELACYDNLGNRAYVAFPVNYDGTEPVTTMTTSPRDFDRDAVTVTLSCADPGGSQGSGCLRTRYSYGGNSYDYSGPFTVTTLAHVNYWSVDQAANFDDRYKTIGVERVAPALTITNSSHTASPTAGWHWSEPTITMTCTDATSGPDRITYTLNGGRLQYYEGPFTLGIQGIVNVSGTCHDVAGNTHNVTLPVRIDTRPPEMTYALAGLVGNAGWFTSNVTVTVTCVDDGYGATRADHRVNNGTWAILPGGIGNLTHDGTRWHEARCSDGIGHNVNASSMVRIDDRAPIASITTDRASPASGPVTVTIGCNDGTTDSGCAGRYWRVAGRPWSIGSSFVLEDEGTFVVDAYAADVAGNVGTVVSRTIVLDVTRPTLGVTMNGTLSPGGWYTSGVLMTATCSDAFTGVAGKEYRLNGGSWVAFATNVSFGVSASRALDVRCRDVAGNEEIWSTTLRIDRNAPVVGQFGATYSEAGYNWVWWNVTDAVSGLASVVVEYAPGGTSSWSAACAVTGPASPYEDSCFVASFYYSTCFRMVITDVAGWTTTSQETCVSRPFD